jgi:3-hydroxyacyl-[acyl-carrier-protein] dehydratase
MLLNDFFTVLAVDGEATPFGEGGFLHGSGGFAGGEHTFKVGLALNDRHRIFEGHFPGQPVVPGACLLQMVREITEMILGKELRLRRADHCKFIALIEPSEDNELEMVLTTRIKEEGLFSVSVNLLNKGAVCFKFSGVFRIAGGN